MIRESAKFVDCFKQSAYYAEFADRHPTFLIELKVLDVMHV